MAILSKIRQRSLLAIFIIGFCLFAFIIGDLVQSNLSSRSSNNVGSINGKDIPLEEFRQKVENAEKNSQGASRTQAANQVWNQEVSIALLTEQFEKLGIGASKKQLIEVLKQSQDIGQNPMFLNDAKEFDLKKFQDFINSASPEQKQLLSEREKDATMNAKYQNYNNMIRAAVYVTNVEAKLKYEMESNKVDFDFVAVPYSSIKDSDIKVSDDEYVAYMKKNEKKYKAEANRELEYVVIEDKPSAEDDAAVLEGLKTVINGSEGKESFQNAQDNMEFVNSNSDIPFDSTFIPKKDLPSEYADQLFNLATGSVFGPYKYNGYYAYSKSLGRQSGATAKASHILIAYKDAMRAAPTVTRTKEEAAIKAAEILAEVQKNPQGFMMQAYQFSDDSSKQQGGDLGYFSKGQMTKKFNDFVFGNPVGKIGLVETEFGYHIINVTDKQDAIKLATIGRKIEPSEATSDKVYQKATQFEKDAIEKSMTDVAKKAGITLAPAVKVKAMDETVGQLTNQRQIVSWAFSENTKVGDVKRFEIPNVGSAIIKVKSEAKEGLMSVADVKPMLESLLKNKKKAEKIIAKMKGASLEDVARTNAVTVQSATGLTIDNAVLPGSGMEQKVVAIAFVSNKISKPIEGNTGVYVVKAKNVVKAPALKLYTEIISKLKQQNANVSGRAISIMKDAAKIEDNRQLFF